MPTYPLPTSGLVPADIGEHPGADDDHLVNHYQVHGKLNGAHVDVKADFGAVGDGVADDTAKIEAALDALAARGGGVCFLPAGTYKVSQYENPDHDGIWSAIQVRNGCAIVGAGSGATTIVLAASQGDHAASHVISNRDQAGPNHGIRYEGFTIDGNAADQTHLFMGILTTRTRGVTYRDVTVKNVRGTGNAPPNETFGIENSYCTDVHHENCTVYGGAGSTATGFSCDVSTNIAYVDCRAFGMTEGHGFTHWHCSNVRYTGCTSQLNGDAGFNSEYSFDVTWTACTGGGSSNDEDDSYPYAASTDLGNGGSGFVANASTRVRLIGCSGINNGGNGFTAVNSGTDYPEGQIIGGHFTGNAGHGLYFGPSDEVAKRWRVSTETMFQGNTGTDCTIGTTIGDTDAAFDLPGITVPGDGVQWINPYPWDVEVYSYGGGNLDYLTLGGAAIIGDVRRFRVAHGSAVTPHYSGSAPDAWVAYRV